MRHLTHVSVDTGMTHVRHVSENSYKHPNEIIIFFALTLIGSVSDTRMTLVRQVSDKSYKCPKKVCFVSLLKDSLDIYKIRLQGLKMCRSNLER